MKLVWYFKTFDAFVSTILDRWNPFYTVLNQDFLVC